MKTTTKQRWVIVNGVDWNNLPESVPELAASSHPQDVWHGIRTSYGDYQVLVQSGDALSEGGVAGGIYALDDGGEILVSQKPDYNAFVPSDERGHRGFLYTAWEDVLRHQSAGIGMGQYGR